MSYQSITPQTGDIRDEGPAMLTEAEVYEDDIRAEECASYYAGPSLVSYSGTTSIALTVA